MDFIRLVANASLFWVSLRLWLRRSVLDSIKVAALTRKHILAFIYILATQMYFGIHSTIGYAILNWGSCSTWLRNMILDFMNILATQDIFRISLKSWPRNYTLGFMGALAAQLLIGFHLCNGYATGCRVSLG